MARKKVTKNQDDGDLLKNTHIANAGEMIEQHITDTLEINYMPYARRA